MQGIDRMMDRKAERGEWSESTALQVGKIATNEGSTTAGGHSHAPAPTNMHTHAHALALACAHTCSSTHALASSCDAGIGNTVVVAKRNNVPREEERARHDLPCAPKQQSTHRYLFVDCVFFIHAPDNSRKEDSALSVRGRAAVDLDLCGKNASRSRAAAEWFFKKHSPIHTSDRLRLPLSLSRLM